MWENLFRELARRRTIGGHAHPMSPRISIPFRLTRSALYSQVDPLPFNSSAPELSNTFSVAKRNAHGTLAISHLPSGRPCPVGSGAISPAQTGFKRCLNG
jgi:hypothetical protein